MLRNLLSLNRRIRFVATVTAMVSIGLGLFVVIRTAPYGIARLIVEHEMSKIFKQEITIDEMSGNIFSVATFKGIHFKNKPEFGQPGVVLDIEEATAHYSLIRTIAHHGDFAAGTHTLRLKGMVINAHKNRDDLWNVLMIIPPPDPRLKPQPLTFHGRIYIEESTIHIQDDRGWGSHPAPHPFRDDITDLTGIVDCKDIKNARIAWSGALGIPRSPFQLVGNLNTTNGQWAFKIQSDNVPLIKWGPYVLPQSGVSLSGGSADIDVFVRSKLNPPKTEFPLWYTVDAALHRARFRLALFPIPATEIKGTVRLYNTLFKDGAPLNKMGHRQNTIIELNIRSAAIGKSPFSAVGAIALDSHTIAINLKSSALDFKSIKLLFPSLQTWKMMGTGIASLNVSGPLSSPNVNGRYIVANATAYGFPVEKLDLSIGYGHQLLTIQSVSGTVHDGPFAVSASVSFNATTPHIHAVLDSTQMDVNRIGPNSGVKGRLSTQITLDGPTPRLSLAIRSTSKKGIQWMNQLIHSAVIDGWVLNTTNLVVDRADFWINDNDAPIHTYGLIRDWQVADFAFESHRIRVRDIQPDRTGLGTADISGRFSALLTPEFWESPKSTLVVTANGTLAHFSVYTHPFDLAQFDITMSPSTVTIRHLKTAYGVESLVVNGEFVNGTPRHLFIKMDGFTVGDTPLIQSAIPTAFKPFSGVFSGSAIVTPLLSRRQPTESILQSLAISGNIRADQCILRGQPFDTVMFVGDWNGDQLSITQALFQKNKSTIAISGSIDRAHRMALSINSGTTVFLNDFQSTLQSVVGRADGGGSVSGSISGTVDHPHIQLNVDFSKMEFGGVQLRSIRGGFGLADRKLVANNLIIRTREGQFDISGYFNLQPLLAKQIQPMDYDLDLAISPMGLDVFSELVESIRREWIARFGSATVASEVTVRNANITIKPNANPFIVKDKGFAQPVKLIYSVGTDDTSLASLSRVKAQQNYSQYVGDIGLADYLAGTFSGKLRAKSRPGQTPDVSATFEFSDATLSFLHGRRITIDVSTKADLLRYKFWVEKGDMGGSPFDSFTSEGTYEPDGYLAITKSEVNTGIGKPYSILSGRFPLSAYWNDAHIDHPMDLHLNWAGDDVNILSIVIPHLKKVSNSGSIALRVEGPLKHPVFSTEKVELTHASIVLNDQMSPITSPLMITGGTFSIKSNIVTISDISFEWRGVDTMRLGASTPETNRMTLTGSVSIDRLELMDMTTAVLGMNLDFKNAFISVNFPQIYRGQLELHNFKINGPYSIPISKTAKDTQRLVSGTEKETGPIISGAVSLYDGELSMPTIGDHPLRPNFMLNMKGSIKQNVRLVGSLVGEGILADVANRFDLSLAETLSPVIVSGTLNAPKIQNSIVVSTGYINLLNRQFEILSQDRQRPYLKTNQYQIHNNSVEFQTDYSATQNRLVPQLKITALTIIEPLVTATPTTSTLTSDADSSKYTHVLINIRGSAYSLQGFQFVKYVSARADTIDRPEYRGTYRLGNGSNGGIGDASEIAKILAPELLEADTTRSNPGNDRLLTQLGSGAVNYISQGALRGIERGLAKNIGVDDIQINYDLGEALFKNVSNQTVGVSLAKSLLSNQLYVRARTDVDIEKRKYANTLQLSEIELTYYLERNLTLNYANFIDGVGDTRNRYNVKYSYEF